MPELLLTLGADASGAPVSFDLVQMPHLLIGGMVGSGKTTCLDALLAQLPESVIILRPNTAHADEALAALRAAMNEMSNRFETFQAAGVRQITEYALPMPRMVLVLDEFAPLMQNHSTDTERLLTRLAQLGRSAGIHLIIATQRLSPDVISGLLKANFPSRLAFRTVTALHSRALLDHAGAERLTQPGDMLFCPAGAKAPVFVHYTLEEPERSDEDGTEE